MNIRIDFEKFLDHATVDEYILAENPGTSLTWLKEFWVKFLVDGDGQPIKDGMAVIGKLTLRQFRDLRREGELRDIAIPPVSTTS